MLFLKIKKKNSNFLNLAIKVKVYQVLNLQPNDRENLGKIRYFLYLKLHWQASDIHTSF